MEKIAVEWGDVLRCDYSPPLPFFRGDFSLDVLRVRNGDNLKIGSFM